VVKYLRMDGVDDRLQIDGRYGPFTEFELTMKPRPKAWQQYINFGGKPVNSTGSNTDTYSADYQAVYVDGVTVVANTRFIKIDQKQVLRGILKPGVNTGTNGINVFWNGGVAYLEGEIYDLKLYNGTTLVAHYDMSTGTVQDQSGNGRHATLYGGTWLDDGTGGEEPIGEDGSTVFDLKQSIYTDSALQADTHQTIYQDGYTAYDLRQILYANMSTSFDTKQAIFEVSAVHMDTRQVIYETASTAFDTLQEYYQDGMTGSIPFDMRIQLYQDDVTVFDSKQEWYQDGYTLADLKQSIYEVGGLNGDMKLILYSDSFVRGDLRQLIYSDEQIHFDTKQTLYDTKNELIGVVHLKGERKLYIELQGKQELYIPLKGGVSMTVKNPTVNLVAGDSKYLVVSVDGITDLTGCTFKWGLIEKGVTILEKTSTSGISVVDGKVQIKIDPADTLSLHGTYYQECEMTDTLGNVSTIFTGIVTVSKSNV
jgi:hypothetical protein